MDARPNTVYFYATCLVDLFFPQAGLAGIELLEREGIEVVFPEGQTCCGQPAYNAGFHAEALAVAEKQLDLFPEPWPVVLPSGSCAGMMKRHYPPLFSGHPPHPRHEEAQALADRVYELSEFLLDVLNIDLVDWGEPMTAALHVSCHARREMGLADTHKEILGKLGNVTLVEPERATECCGFGGTFAVKRPEISAAMVTDKADALVGTGADVVVSADGGCLANIGGHIAHRKMPTGVTTMAEFLLERTRDK